MRRRFFLCLMLTVCLAYGCGPRRLQYEQNAHALLVGKVDCVTSGWFSDSRRKARIYVHKLRPDGNCSVAGRITSDYTALALEPGVYGLGKAYLEIEAGLTYADYRVPFSGKSNFLPLFQDEFWRLTEVEQALKLGSLAPGLFGVLKVGAGEVIYYGDMTLDAVTTRDRLMFVVTRSEPSARLALDEAHPGQAQSMKNKDWVGASFLLGKIRESRFSGKKPHGGEKAVQE